MNYKSTINVAIGFRMSHYVESVFVNSRPIETKPLGGHPFKTSALGGGEGGPVISDFFGRVTFIFKDKVFICFIFENTAFKYS